MRRLFLLAAAVLAPWAILAARAAGPGGPAAALREGIWTTVAVTVSAAFLVAAVGRRGSDRAADPAALEAIQRAERAVAQSAAVLVRVDALLAAPPRKAAPAPARRFRAGPALVGLALAVAVLAVAGAVLAPRAAEEGPVHHHAAFAVFVRGERVDFSSPAYDLAARDFLRGHLHAPDQDIVHVEGEPGLTLGEFFARTLGARLTSTTLALEGREPLTSGPSEALRVRVAPEAGDAWADVPFPPENVFGAGDRVLVTFGAVERDLAAEEAAVARDIPP